MMDPKLIIMILHGSVIFCLDIAVLRSPTLQNAFSETQFSSNETKAITFLRRYGYLAQPTSRMPLTRALFIKALNNYQVMTNLPINNRLEEQTLSSMDTFRCGNVDVKRNERTGLAKYEIMAPRWRKNNLTWRISRYPVGQPYLTRPVVDNALRTATQMWSNYSKIDFIQLTDNDRRSADIDIKFERSGYDTTCEIWFTMGELAHATMTRNPAKVHFNGRVTWKVGQGNDVDLTAVAAHELGHVLGLDHSGDHKALMYPSYRRQNSDLGRDDIEAVQLLYGVRKPSEKQPETGPIPQPNQTCPKTVTPKTPDGRRPLCAVVYTERVCKGDRLFIESGNKTRQLSINWDNEISSAEVNPQCTLILCHRSFFGGGCIDLRGETEGQNYNRLPLGYDNTITSLACLCDNQNTDTPPDHDSGSDEDTDDSNEADLNIGKEPPPFIPNTNVRTCAVLIADTRMDAAKAWIEEETLMRMPDSLDGITYVYIATRRGCSLFYCSESAFDGLCESIGPSSHVFSSERIAVESLSCECD